MNVHVENLPNCITTMRVEVPPEKVTAAWDRIASDYRQYARIPGYRPGKAPRSVVEAKFRKQIKEELTKKLLSESCREAITAHQLRVVSLAEIDEVEVDDDRSMRFTATLVTAPEFELPDYKNIATESLPAEVREEEVDESIQNLRHQSAEYRDVPGRGLAMEDFAVIDYTGTIDGRPVEELFPKAGKPLSGNQDFWIRMTPESFFPGFCEPLVEAAPGESRTFTIEVPPDFAVEEMGGQKIEYHVTVKAVKEQILPEISDEWAGTIVEGKTLGDLRELARVELEQQKATRNDRERKNQIMQHLLRSVECELPTTMVRSETKRILADIVRENQARGVSDELMKQSEKELVGAASQGARDRLKGSFILLRIAEAEKMSVTREEFQYRIITLAQRYGLTPEKMRKELEKRGALDQISEEILTAKVLDFLNANATVPPTVEAA